MNLLGIFFNFQTIHNNKGTHNHFNEEWTALKDAQRQTRRIRNRLNGFLSNCQIHEYIDRSLEVSLLSRPSSFLSLALIHGVIMSSNCHVIH